MVMNNSYAEQSAAFAGMLADLGRVKDAAPYVQGEASAEIAFGAGVVEGTAATEAGGFNGAVLPVDANSVFAGVLLHSHDYDPRTELGTTGVKPGAAVSVLKKGRVWVYTETTVAKGATLFLRHTTNGAGTAKGQFRNDADTANAIEVPVIAVDGRTGAGLVLVEVDYVAGRIAAQI
jgi:hypothetical protein